MSNQFIMKRKQIIVLSEQSDALSINKAHDFIKYAGIEAAEFLLKAKK